MTRIVIDPAELQAASAELGRTAGEYQAIGTRAATCDCGCMPADVAAVVDATTAAIRSQLNSLAAWLSADSGDLAWRAGVPQTGASGAAISAASGAGVAASGGGTTLVIGGDPSGLFSASNAGGTTLTIGGDPYGLFAQPGSSGTMLVIGGDSSGLFSEPSSGGSTLIIGGDTSFSGPSSGGYTLTIPGTPLYEPGEEEALRRIWEHHLPLEQFFPRGIGVNINPPFMPNLILMGDVMNAMSYNPWTDPMGATPSYYNYYTHGRVFFT